MDLVVDASVIIAVIVNEPIKRAIVRVTQDADLIAPESMHWEIGNAFSAMFKRRRIEIHDALRAIEIYRQIPIRFVHIDLERALYIANQQNIYAYDAYMLECARRYNAQLISLDADLLTVSEQMNIKTLRV